LYSATGLWLTGYHFACKQSDMGQRCCVSQAEQAYSLHLNLHPSLMDFGLQPHTALVCRLMITSPIIQIRRLLVVY